MQLMWREGRRALRMYTRRDWLVLGACLAPGVVVNVILIRAYEGHGRETLGIVLLVGMLLLAFLAIVGTPVLYWWKKQRAKKRDHRPV